jgi:hypothetical protein
MLPSEESAKLSALLVEMRRQIERTIQAGELSGVPREDVTSLVSGAVKLYATAVEEAELDVPVIDGTVSTTEAMVVACALLRAHHLNPFDLALWFSRAAPNAR